MIEFGKLTEQQVTSYKNEVNKKPEKIYSEEEMMMWPEDDDEAVKEYFDKKK